jgi:hypothetical protein
MPRACGRGIAALKFYGPYWTPAGVGFEDRKLLLGHNAGHVTTHYSAPENSAPEIETLIQASEKVCEPGSRKTHARIAGI